MKCAKLRTKLGGKVRYVLARQGKLLVVKTIQPSRIEQRPPERKAIQGFSRNSRWRLLKRIAAINWQKLKSGMFVTLTYPDEILPEDMAVATMHRHWWMRYAENHLKEKIPILWRKEQQIRKSGRNVGWAVPHFHLSVFTAQKIECWRINDWWKRAIGWQHEVQTHRRYLDSAEHAAFYLAKYLSKKDGEAPLDHYAYLNKPGRAWGFHRFGLIPHCPVEWFETYTPEVIERALEVFVMLKNRELDYSRGSLTLVGKQADEVMQELSGFLT